MFKSCCPDKKMAVRLSKCTSCKSYRLEKLRDINPETRDMNMKVIAKCLDCKHEDQYNWVSHYTQERRRRGLIW